MRTPMLIRYSCTLHRAIASTLLDVTTQRPQLTTETINVNNTSTTSRCPAYNLASFIRSSILTLWFLFLSHVEGGSFCDVVCTT